MKPSIYQILQSPRLVAILMLGIASGLPLALTGTTLQAWFTEANINLITIGALSLVGIPYILKFLWAPVMDHYGFGRFGKRKGWMLFCQAALVVALLAIANMQPNENVTLMSWIAFAIAFFSASQDVAISAYQTDVLQPEERGLGASYIVFGYRIAMLVSGGLALVFAQHLGWRLTYELMAVIMLLCMLGTYYSPAVSEVPVQNNFLETIKCAVRDLLERPGIFIILSFIFLYKFGDALALSLITNFLLHTLGFSLTEVGLVFKIVGVIAVLSGGFVGGLLLTRWNLFRALLIFGLAQSFSNLLFVVLAASAKSFTLMAITVFVENFCSGLSTAALLTLMMSLCNHRYTATQFALFSAIASLGRVFLGPIAAVLVLHIGWLQFYCWAFVLCFPSLILLVMMKERVVGHAVVATD